MNIRLLKFFAAVAETSSVTRAAETLHTTQPAVSQALSQLEKATNLALFDRLGKKLHLTEQGKLFLEKTRLLLQQYDELEHSASALADEATLRVGSCITIAWRWLPAIVRDYESQPNAAPLAIDVASASAILDKLSANAIDIALYEGPAPAQPFVSFPFSSYRLACVCPPGHAFADREIALSTLLSEPLLLRERGSAVRDVFDSHLRLKQKQACPKMTSVNSQTLIQAVKNGLGIAILPDVVAGPEIERGALARFTVKGMRLGNDNRVVIHQDKRRGKALERFIAAALRGGKSALL